MNIESKRSVALERHLERLEFALEASGIGWWVLDLEDHTAERALQHDIIFGYERLQEEWTHERFLSHVYPEDWECVDEALRRTIEGGEDLDFTCRIRRADGEVRWIRSRGRVFPAEDKTPRRMLGVVEDVTEKKRAEQELRELTATLEERVAERTRKVRQLAADLTRAETRERRRIARVLHDDLQQLIYSIKLQLSAQKSEVDALWKKLQEAGLAEVAGLAEDTGAAARVGDEACSADARLRTIREGLAELGEVAEAALVATRDLSRQLSPPVQVEKGFKTAVDWLASGMRERFGLTVEVEGPDDVPIQREEVSLLVYESVRELLFNVAKHADTDRARVILSIDEKTEETVTGGADTRWLRVEVADEGRGFDSKAVEASTPPGGGLGLRHVRERLELLEGTLEVHSAPGEGTTVHVAVPLAS